MSSLPVWARETVRPTGQDRLYWRLATGQAGAGTGTDWPGEDWRHEAPRYTGQGSVARPVVASLEPWPVVDITGEVGE